MFLRLGLVSRWPLSSLRRRNRPPPDRCRLQIEALESRHLLTTFFIADPQFSGDDANAGTDDQHAWATIAHVNAAIASGQIQAGDTLCFHRGDTFTGNLVFDGVGGT